MKNATAPAIVESTQAVIDSIIENGRKVARSFVHNFGEAASVGDQFRQGDVYLTKLPDDTNPKSKAMKQLDKVPQQLVPGNDVGSQHVLETIDGVSAYQLNGPTDYGGTVLNITKANRLNHPKHGDVVLSPGWYAVTYQRTVDSDEKIARVRD